MWYNNNSNNNKNNNDIHFDIYSAVYYRPNIRPCPYVLLLNHKVDTHLPSPGEWKAESSLALR